MGWIILVLLLVGGYFAYRYLVGMEAGIRAEINAQESDEDPVERDPEPARSREPEQGEEGASSFQERILAMIRARPGILQTDLYSGFPDVDKKTLQKEVLDLDRSDLISRERSGSTYKLFPPN